MTPVLRMRHNEPTGVKKTLSYLTFVNGCVLLLLVCLTPAAGDAPTPVGDSSAPPGPQCLHDDPRCPSSSSSINDSIRNPDKDAEEGPSHTETDSPQDGDEPELMNFINVDKRTMEYEHEEIQDSPDEVERVLSCIFTSVPFIGGKWLEKIVRNSYSDATLLEASHRFLDGGEFLSKFISLGTSSPAGKMLEIVSSCFEDDEMVDYKGEYLSGYYQDEDEPQNPYQNPIPVPDRNSRPERTQYDLPGAPTSSPLQHTRRKRRLARTFGADSLLGFNLLGTLVVCSLVVYLVYLLV
ncbi:uncharacterized protein LOC121866769 [Homarus americanus]|uniref:Uncharacterized protein n=1 Tax=Homarus americanus TaxID=6706 RepID=A0A8J5K1U3_HOMAM|nr:uncharacterized protein LOC121866769 [Homarus americanus]KAG7168782.1 hypothetical protein Hamer_G021799 [Homarus americanus]